MSSPTSLEIEHLWLFWLPPSSTTLATTPKFEQSCSISPKIEPLCMISGALDLFSVLATTTLYNPLQPPKLSTMLGLRGFRPPPASATLHDPRQPPKSSTMLSFGDFWPPQAPTSFHALQQPPKSSAMLCFGGFRPPLASATLDNPQNQAASVVLDFGGLSTSVPQQPPKLSHRAWFGGLLPLSGYRNHPQQPWIVTLQVLRAIVFKVFRMTCCIHNKFICNLQAWIRNGTVIISSKYIKYIIEKFESQKTGFQQVRATGRCPFIDKFRYLAYLMQRTELSSCSGESGSQTAFSNHTPNFPPLCKR